MSESLLFNILALSNNNSLIQSGNVTLHHVASLNMLWNATNLLWKGDNEISFTKKIINTTSCERIDLFRNNYNRLKREYLI